MNKRRRILLGFNIVLAATILAQPGVASTRSSDDCTAACVREWSECVLDGDWDCYWRINECFVQKCLWGPS